MQGFEVPKGAPNGANTRGTWRKGHFCAYPNLSRRCRWKSTGKVTFLWEMPLAKCKSVGQCHWQSVGNVHHDLQWFPRCHSRRSALCAYGQFSKVQSWKMAQPLGYLNFQRAFWSEHMQWFRDLRPSMWNVANWDYENWPYPTLTEVLGDDPEGPRPPFFLTSCRAQPQTEPSMRWRAHTPRSRYPWQDL